MRYYQVVVRESSGFDKTGRVITTETSFPNKVEADAYMERQQASVGKDSIFSTYEQIIETDAAHTGRKLDDGSYEHVINNPVIVSQRFLNQLLGESNYLREEKIANRLRENSEKK